MATKIGDRRVCASCGTQIIVIREGAEGFAVKCCGALLDERVACGSAITAPATERPT